MLLYCETSHPMSLLLIVAFYAAAQAWLQTLARLGLVSGNCHLIVVKPMLKPGRVEGSEQAHGSRAFVQHPAYRLVACA